MNGTGAAVVAVLLALVAVGGARRRAAWPAARRRAASSARPAERATFATLHTASLAAPPLREGLTADRRRAARPGTCATLLGTPAVALTDVDDHARLGRRRATTTRRHAVAHAAAVLRTGRTAVLGARHVACDDARLPDPDGGRVRR